MTVKETESVQGTMDSRTEKRKTPVLYLVVPCYNEEEVIEKSARVLGDRVLSTV